MHKKVWFLAAAAFALIAIVGSASAMAGSAGGRAAARVPALPSMFASYPKTPAARAHASVMNIAQEQDLPTACSWNFLKVKCNKAWSIWVGVNPILRGPYLVAYVGGKYTYQYDLATKVVANNNYIKYTINKKAKWNYGGVLSPVTWQDFVYSVEMLNDPGNQVAGNTGVNQISGFSHSGNTVTFFWKKPGQKALGGDSSTANCDSSQGNACGPFADYKDTIGVIMPKAATQSLNFNTQLFHDCICGANGKYITDGPYYMDNYVRGQGTTLKANPKGWHGAVQAKTQTLNFTDVADTNSEIQEIKGGEVDVASPQPTPAIAPLAHLSTIHYKVTPGNYLEHIDISEGTGKTHNPLLKQAWFRQAIMMGINRQGLINAALPGVAPKGSLTPLNSILVFQADPRYKAPFKTYDYAATGAGKGTIAMMKKHHCTGGPSKPVAHGNTHFWTCGGHAAAFQFLYANDNLRRVNSSLVIAANLQSVGINVNLVGEQSGSGGPFFTDAQTPNGGYDTTEFAWGGSIDPAGFASIWECGGTDNNGLSCSPAGDHYFSAALSQLNNTKRNTDIIKADKAYSTNINAIPLYALPEVDTYKTGITGVSPDPAAGFTWNAENWRWK